MTSLAMNGLLHMHRNDNQIALKPSINNLQLYFLNDKKELMLKKVFDLNILFLNEVK